MQRLLLITTLLLVLATSVFAGEVPISPAPPPPPPEGGLVAVKAQDSQPSFGSAASCRAEL